MHIEKHVQCMGVVTFIILEGCISCVAEGEVVDCEARITGTAGILAALEQPAAETMLPECMARTIAL